MRAPTPKSLILDLLSTLSGGAMPVAALIEAGEILEIPGSSLRVALARLLAAGRVERDGRGRYRLGASSDPVDALVRSWRHLDRRTRPWTGGWLAAHLTPGAARGTRTRSLRALRLLGFAELSPGLHLRPANLREKPATTRSKLLALQLEAATTTCELRELDPAAASRALELWDRGALRDAYLEMRIRLEEGGARLAGLDPTAAMAESFLLGGQAIQQLALDPLLPEEILPTRDRDALVAALRDYDTRGRACWAALLERHAVPHRAAPQDTRVAANLDRLRA